jgi:hypothetical protein
MDKPDWEGFGRAVFEATDWPEHSFDIDGIDAFEMAKKYGVVRQQPGGFDPESDYDPTGLCAPGDEWWVYVRRRK